MSNSPLWRAGRGHHVRASRERTIHGCLNGTVSQYAGAAEKQNVTGAAGVPVTADDDRRLLV